MAKQAIFTVTPRFSARRMVKDYVAGAYAPALATDRTGAAGTSGTFDSGMPAAVRRVLTRPTY